MTRPTPTAPDSRKLYDRLWRDSLRKGKEELGDLEQAIEFLKSLPVLTSRSVIVEIGCGTGKLCEALYRVGYEHAVGADIAQRALSFGKNRYPYLSLLCMDGATLALRSGSVDICLSFDFVEHLADVDRHFREVCRVLVAEGIYLFQTPNRVTNPIIETIRWRGWRW
ncbi:class I SAM-dependent methyltransferase, partial [Candidatus Sumerlaeota bacterium]|nr:class I SAM-dependent methyltransferase [Candidatus Sumerlaeota bacterium]